MVNLVLLSEISLEDQMISGTYTITTIILTVFSIIASLINTKIMGIKPFRLKRYKISHIFLPVLMHLGYLWLVFLTDFWKEPWIVMMEATIILLYVAVDTCYILEPYYNDNHFKKTLIKRKIDDLRKIEKKTSEELILKYIEKDFDMIEKSINNKNDILTINQEDIIEYINQVFDVIAKDIKSDSLSLMLLNKIKELNIEIEDYINNPLLSIGAKLEFYKNNQNDEMTFNSYKNMFNLIYDVCNNNQNPIDEEHRTNLKLGEEYKKYFITNTIRSKIQTEYLVEVLFDEKWQSSDVPFLSYYFLVIYRLSKMFDLGDKNNTSKKIEYIEHFFDSTNQTKEYGENIYNLLLKVKTNIEKEMEQ